MSENPKCAAVRHRITRHIDATNALLDQAEAAPSGSVERARLLFAAGKPADLAFNLCLRFKGFMTEEVAVVTVRHAKAQREFPCGGSGDHLN